MIIERFYAIQMPNGHDLIIDVFQWILKQTPATTRLRRKKPERFIAPKIVYDRCEGFGTISVNALRYFYSKIVLC